MLLPILCHFIKVRNKFAPLLVRTFVSSFSLPKSPAQKKPIVTFTKAKNTCGKAAFSHKNLHQYRQYKNASVSIYCFTYPLTNYSISFFTIKGPIIVLPQ